MIDRGIAAAPIGEETLEMTDEQIIGRVRGGETRAFGELVARYQDSVYGMALRFVGGRGDAEDVAQEVFLRAYRGLEGFKGNAKLSTWLYRITFNLCADWLRRNKRADRMAATIETAAELADNRVNLEEGVVMAEERDSAPERAGPPGRRDTAAWLCFFIIRKCPMNRLPRCSSCP